MQFYFISFFFFYQIHEILDTIYLDLYKHAFLLSWESNSKNIILFDRLQSVIFKFFLNKFYMLLVLFFFPVHKFFSALSHFIIESIN